MFWSPGTLRSLLFLLDLVNYITKLTKIQVKFSVVITFDLGVVFATFSRYARVTCSLSGEDKHVCLSKELE